MPGGGPVYQPTTVSYEPQNQWASPAGFLAQNGAVGRAKCVKYVALVIGLIGIASGLVMIIEGSVDLSDTEEHDEAVGHTTAVEEVQSEKDVTVVIIGALLLCMGLAFVIFYLMIAFRRRGCPCLMSKEQRMARALRSPHTANGHGMNPSTDLLVAAQYAPVSEIAFQPPAVAEEEETRKLMGSDNKDCILKESDSMISLNQDKFEPADSPAPRRLRNYPPIATSILPDSLTLDTQKPSDVLHQEKFSVDDSDPSNNQLQKERRMHEDDEYIARSQAVGRKSSWRQAIQRKASVRSKKAPLAAGEEITPSLSSSYSSICFNDSKFESDDDNDVDSLRSVPV